MPLIETRGAGSAQGFGEFAQSAAVNYIEDVFSTYLYTGNGSTQTITNGIDLSGKGGLVWLKWRSAGGLGSASHFLYDTNRGVGNALKTNTSGAESQPGNDLSAFNSNGFAIGSEAQLNNSSGLYASWTFRKQKKFFDVVTYTGNGQNDRQISHNLGSTPGCIIVKCLYFTGAGGPANWSVYHRSISPSQSLFLNTTAAAAANDGLFGTPTSTYFVVNQPGGGNTLNANGDQYVAYIFAHDAGGFGLSGSDNVISCGSYTGNGSSTGPTITLGYEPQWVMVKRTTVSTGSWEMYDSMRGFTMGADAVLRADTSGAEFSLQRINPTSTGFQLADSDGDVNANGSTYIYIAIRRGPMKVPTSGTSVFSPTANTTAIDATTPVVLTPDASDLWLNSNRGSAAPYWLPRLAAWGYTRSSNTTSEDNTSYTWTQQTQSNLLPSASWWSAGTSQVNYFFRRAPGFFDVVCFTATGSNFSVTHNLGAVPELVITKERNGSRSWYTYAAGAGNTKYLALDGTAAATTGNAWQDTTPTSTTLYLTGGSSFFSMSQTYVAYLFATLAGVSKVGTYTGTGTTLQIDCGFTGGARFVLIKRTDSTGDWYVWDTARGIVSGNDPYLLLNSTAAEVTNTDYVDTYSAGFELSSTAPAALNANGGTYIFLAIA